MIYTDSNGLLPFQIAPAADVVVKEVWHGRAEASLTDGVTLHLVQVAMSRCLVDRISFPVTADPGKLRCGRRLSHRSGRRDPAEYRDLAKSG